MFARARLLQLHGLRLALLNEFDGVLRGRVFVNLHTYLLELGLLLFKFLLLEQLLFEFLNVIAALSNLPLSLRYKAFVVEGVLVLVSHL